MKITDASFKVRLEALAKEYGYDTLNYNNLTMSQNQLSAFECGVEAAVLNILPAEVERWKEIAEASHTDAEYFALQHENNTFRDRSKLLLETLMLGNMKMKTYHGVYKDDIELTYILKKWNEVISSCLVLDKFTEHLAAKAEERNETL